MMQESPCEQGLGDTDPGGELRTHPLDWRGPALTILGHPDVVRVGERALLDDLAAGGEDAISRTAPTFRALGASATQPLDHKRVSREPLWVGRERTGELVLRPASERVRASANGRPIRSRLTLAWEALEEGVVLVLNGQVVLLLNLGRAFSAQDAPEGHGLVGVSDVTAALRREIDRAAASDGPVLICGPTGAGKGRVARAIHDASGRRRGPWVQQPVATVPPDVLPALLFGAAPGHPAGGPAEGAFARAHGGTLYLDGVEALPEPVQASLVEAIEHRAVRRVGEAPSRPVDVRVIASSAACVEDLVSGGVLADRLVHRLRRTEVHVGELAARRADVGVLFVHFVRRAARALEAGDPLRAAVEGGADWLPAGLVEGLALYRWPGNVLELENVAHQVVQASAGEPALRVPPAVRRLLDGATAHGRAGPGHPAAAPQRPRRSPAEITPQEYRSALERHGHAVAAAARDLGVSRAAVYRFKQEHELPNGNGLSEARIREALAASGGSLAGAAARLGVGERALRLRMTALGLP